MYLFVAGVLAGVVAVQWFAHLPNAMWFFVAAFFVAIIWFFSSKIFKVFLLLLFAALIGCGYAIIRAQAVLSWNLPAELETKTVTVVGTITALPQIEDGQAQFEFALRTLNGKPQQTRLRLAWYQLPHIILQVGDSWQFQVKLKRPHGLLNPGGFDYEKWLFSRGIRATGYILNNGTARKISNNSWRYPIDRFRELLQQKIQQNLVGQDTAGLIAALVMGAQNNITAQQWQTMRATGTNHLMAIAGVHIGFVAGFIYLLLNFIWRRIPKFVLRMPAQEAATIAALITAFIYSALAGFSLPTQRALIMLLAFSINVLLRRKMAVWDSFALALLLILIIEPFATFSVSFWLSFGAVFAILYGIGARLKPSGLWWKYGRIQWVITVGLVPITLILFQQTSLISLFANMFAVPSVGILVLPLCLIGTILLFIYQPLGHLLLLLSAQVISGIWWVLAWLAQINGAVWQQTIPNIWILFATLIGVLLIIAPQGMPGRWLGVLWCFPLFYQQPISPKSGEIWLTLLDVGQGLSALIRTQHHALLFDTGPPLGKLDDAGQRVILPYLQQAHLDHVDTLVISHGDSDHIGGANSVVAGIPVESILTSVPGVLGENRRCSPGTAASMPKRFIFTDKIKTKKIPRVIKCVVGQHWQWDGVDFIMLHPSKEFFAENNNGSCVLRIGQGKKAILLTGDIEKPVEQFLLQQQNIVLSAQILIAPHHGSRTSSTAAFIRTTAAKYVLFPTGYKNRFHFPNTDVLKRYQTSGAQLLDTAISGAITMHIDYQGRVIKVQRLRQDQHKFWYDNFF